MKKGRVGKADAAYRQSVRESIVQMLRAGRRYAEIAAALDTSVSYISIVAGQAGLRKPRKRHNERGAELEANLDTLVTAAQSVFTSYLSENRVQGLKLLQPDHRAAEAEMLARKGLSLRDIGAKLGVTGERVRTILLTVGLTTLDLRPRRPVFNPRTGLLPGFKKSMYDWLRGAGYYRCSYCGWQAREKFYPTIGPLCRDCNAVRCRVRYHRDPVFRERAKQIAKKSRDKAARERMGSI